MTMNSEPKALKEIHDIREKIYEETRNLSPEDKTERRNRIAREVAEKYGLKIKQKV